MKKKNNKYHKGTSISLNHSVLKGYKSQKGFTLLETLVAIFILTLAITGPVYIASVAFRNTIDSRDNISAQYIAEEVIEVIRNKRDKNALALDNAVADWVVGLGLGTDVSCLNSVGGVIDNKCIMEKESSTSDGNYIFKNCINGVCPNISFDPEKDVVYGQSGVSSQSKFIREFYFQAENDGIKIVVNIRWNDKGRNKVYTLTERLYNVNYRKYYIED